MNKTPFDPDRPLSLRTLVTPEGVDLGVRLADMGQRFGALMIDLMVIVSILIAGIVIVVSAGNSIDGELAIILIQLVFFTLRNFYFLIFEMGTRAATPGKRIMKIRVASRTGARLDTSSVFARNALREIELFIPALILLSGGTLTGQDDIIDKWIWLVALIWVCTFAFFPLMNRDRLRLGDLVAGTWVVRAPKPVLLDDLSETMPDAAPDFTNEQIEAYGIKELHALEDVLRARDSKIMFDVARRIQTKINWTEPHRFPSDETFLRAYYGALRAHLENDLIMGRRRKDKFDKDKR